MFNKLLRKVLAMSAIFAVSASYALTADSTSQEKPERAMMGSNYYAYPTPTSKLTKTPLGYKPFYLSHYGRHGSRYLKPGATYSDLYEILAKADSAKALTDLGKSLLERASKLKDFAAKEGDLTQTGVKQHQGIAQRMFKNFSDLFYGEANIEAYASTSVRCVVSMAAFLEELRAQNPKLRIYQESSGSIMNFINPANFGTVINNANTAEWQKANSKLYSKVDPSRMMSSIFNNPTYIKKNINISDLHSKIYDITSNLQDLDNINFNFDDLWTEEELSARWHAQNAWWYSVLGYCPLSGAKGPSTAKPVLKNILDVANEIIAIDTAKKISRHPTATLRFGHDTALMPLAALMQLDFANANVSDMDELHKVWRDYKIIPMAANLQMVFYKSSKKDAPILVKILYNEEEQKIPVTCKEDDNTPKSSNPFLKALNTIKCPEAPYYRWDDVREFYQNIIQQD